MSVLKKLFLLLILFGAVGMSALEIPAGTPVFASPDPRTQPLATATETFDVKVVDRKVFFLPYDFMVRRMMFYKIEVAKDRTAFCSPEL